MFYSAGLKVASWSIRSLILGFMHTMIERRGLPLGVVLVYGPACHAKFQLGGRRARVHIKEVSHTKFFVKFAPSKWGL